MTNKQQNNLIVIAGIIGLVLFVSGGIPGFGPQAITQEGAGTQVDGVTVFIGTPTIQWSASDKITGNALSYGFEAFRVTIGGVASDELGSTTANAAIGDAFEICLLPNSTYYAGCETGLVEATVTRVDIETYAIGSASAFWNNDSENATQRNATGARDDLSAGDTDTPTLCVQGTTANASFGDGSFVVIFDYNANQLAAPPIWSAGTRNDSVAPSTYSLDANLGTAKVVYVVSQALTNVDTVCGTVTVVNGATEPVMQRYIEANILDHFGSKNTVTNALEFGYAGLVTGLDTNSATNASITYYIE